MQQLQELFDSKTIPEPNSGCLLWLDAPTGLLGHGQLKIAGKSRMASHVALELAGRPLPVGMFACHRCDNPACVNPDHLFFGTQKDNVHDALSKGRHNVSGLRLGPGHNRLPRDLKERAAVLYAQHGPRTTRIARELGLPLTTIQDWLYEFGHVPKKVATRRKRGETHAAA